MQQTQGWGQQVASSFHRLCGRKPSHQEGNALQIIKIAEADARRAAVAAKAQRASITKERAEAASVGLCSRY